MEKITVKAIALSFAFLLLFQAGCRSEKQIPITDQEVLTALSGTWIRDWNSYPKRINYSDGRFELYSTLAAERPSIHGEIVEIDEAWTVKDGTIWYKARFQPSVGALFYNFGRISDSGQAWDRFADHYEYAEVFDLESPLCAHYRKEE